MTTDLPHDPCFLCIVRFATGFVAERGGEVEGSHAGWADRLRKDVPGSTTDGRWLGEELLGSHLRENASLG